MFRKTLITISDGTVRQVDTIAHDGDLWLVPKWLDGPYPGYRRPWRMIRLSPLKPRIRSDSGFLLRFEVQEEVPIELLDGELGARGDLCYEFVEKPRLFVSTVMGATYSVDPAERRHPLEQYILDRGIPRSPPGAH